MNLPDRIAGALLGVHAGDALGATREFGTADPTRSHRDITGGGPFKWAAGEPTDDTAQTAVVLSAYREGYSLRRVADGLLTWYLAGPKDVGGGTASALQRYSKVRDPERSGAGPGQCGNGSLMRCLPTGLVRTNPIRRATEARAVSALTHDDVVCTEACVAYCDIIAALLDGAAPVEALRASTGACFNDEVATAIALGCGLNLKALADEGDSGVRHGNRGYVLSYRQDLWKLPLTSSRNGG